PYPRRAAWVRGDAPLDVRTDHHGHTGGRFAHDCAVTIQQSRLVQSRLNLGIPLLGLCIRPGHHHRLTARGDVCRHRGDDALAHLGLRARVYPATPGVLIQHGHVPLAEAETGLGLPLVVKPHHILEGCVHTVVPGQHAQTTTGAHRTKLLDVADEKELNAVPGGDLL